MTKNIILTILLVICFAIVTIAEWKRPHILEDKKIDENFSAVETWINLPIIPTINGAPEDNMGQGTMFINSGDTYKVLIATNSTNSTSGVGWKKI